MKIAFAWKWWAGKTTLSSLVIKKLAEKLNIMALDLDSNVNLAVALWMEKQLDNLVCFGQKKHEIMKYTGSTEMTAWEDRIYLPKESDWFYDLKHDFIHKNSIIQNNVKLMSLGFIDDDKRGIESMCDYYEMAKVFMNHFNVNQWEILVWDLAAGMEMISRATVMSFDLIFVITDANFKNIKVAKQILSTLDLTSFTRDEIVIIPNKYLDDEDLDSIKNNFSDYNILPGIEFNEEIYELDSQKQLSAEKNEWLNESVDNITDYILEYYKNNKKSQSEIYSRIKLLDEKKENFLK